MEVHYNIQNIPYKLKKKITAFLPSIIEIKLIIWICINREMPVKNKLVYQQYANKWIDK